jgi:hypothetical protein
MMESRVVDVNSSALPATWLRPRSPNSFSDTEPIGSNVKWAERVTGDSGPRLGHEIRMR